MFDTLLFSSIKLLNGGGKFYPLYKKTVTAVVLSTLNQRKLFVLLLHWMKYLNYYVKFKKTLISILYRYIKQVETWNLQNRVKGETKDIRLIWLFAKLQAVTNKKKKKTKDIRRFSQRTQDN